MRNHKLGRHQLLVLKLIVENYKQHFLSDGFVKKDEKNLFIHDLERSLEEMHIHRGIKNLRKVIQNKYFRAELSRILDRHSIGIQTTFLFWNQPIPDDESQEFIVIPENDEVPNANVPHQPVELSEQNDVPDYDALQEKLNQGFIELSDDEAENDDRADKKGEINGECLPDEESLSVIVIEDSSDNLSFHPEITSSSASLAANANEIDRTLSACSNISEEPFIYNKKPLPYIPGQLQETIVDENEEDSVPVNTNRYKNIFGYPNFAYSYHVLPHSSALDRILEINDEFVTKRKK